MTHQQVYNAEVLDWLLQAENPEVAYLTRRDLLKASPTDPEMIAWQEKAHQQGAIAQVLSHMEDEGYWESAGSGYNPKYLSTVWSLILLAQLGGSIHLDDRIRRACTYYMDQAFTITGAFSTSQTPSGTADCLQGNMCWALITLGCEDDRIDHAYEWMARTVTGEGMAAQGEKDAPYRYYAGKCGPLFSCGSNDRKPCAWGAAKVMAAFSVLPVDRRTPLIDRAIGMGTEFLLGIDPMTGEYPHPYTLKPSGNWWKFGFPVFYVADLLQVAEFLAVLGHAKDPRLAGTIEFIRSKQDSIGCWPLEYDYSGKTWLEFGEKKKPNKWVTLRALRLLSLVEN